eukprot:gene4539-5655_t
MGKQRARDNYWDSDQFEKDREDAEQSESSESEEEVPVKKGGKNNKPTPAQSKKPAAGKKKVESESESSEEEIPQPKKGGGNNNKSNNNNNKKGAAGKKKVESESESSEEEEPVKKPTAQSKKAPAKAAAKKKPVESESESSEEESESESSSEEEPVKKPTPAQSKKAPAKPAPAQSKKKAATPPSESESSEEESESESSSEEEVKKPTPAQSKKAPAKPAPAQSKKKPAAAPAKKQAANKKQDDEPPKISAYLLKQREEEERKEREKQEKKRLAEEERIRKEEEARIKEEESKIKSEERQKKKAESREKQETESKEQARLAKLAKLTGNVQVPAATDEKKKVVYEKKKKNKQPSAVNQITEAVAQVKLTEEPTATGEVEVMDNWDDEDWESLDDIQKRKDEEAQRLKDEEEKKKREEKEAKKAAKQANKKGPKKPVEETTTTTTGATAEEKPEELRSPILCILGHVDTGKTSLLDKIRNTNVQGGEARGITQQIGASFIPVEAIKEKTKSFAEKVKMDFKLPGLLLIDTPGHESFNNLRSRGSGLCDLAILVIDIMHGLEAQTLESIELLRMRKTPFIVALNKVDRIYDWKPCVNTDFKESLKLQSRLAAQEFEQKVRETVAGLAAQELNAELYWRNKDHRKYVSLVPTSAHTGEGLSDLMLVVIQLMQKIMLEKVVYSSKLQCTLLEVKMMEGYGTTVDAVLVNGVLNEGDRVIVSGFNGPIETTIRTLLTPPPLRESRVKSQFVSHKSIRASMGVKIVAPNLTDAVPGTSLIVINEGDDVEQLKSEAKREVESVLNDVETSGIGVSVQASTLGSLEAFLNFLKKIKVPVASVAIGPVHKKHIMNTAIMHEKDAKYAVLLAFDVKVEESAKVAAEEMKVTVFQDETIYLFEKKLKEYFGQIKETLRSQTANICVWPCLLEITEVFRNKNPIVCAVKVKEGTLRVGTPIIVPESGMSDVGIVQSIKLNDKEVQIAKKDDHVSVGFDDSNTKTTFGRHFDDKKIWYSKITRESLDALKAAWADELTKQDIQLLKYMKTVFKIQ